MVYCFLEKTIKRLLKHTAAHQFIDTDLKIDTEAFTNWFTLKLETMGHCFIKRKQDPFTTCNNTGISNPLYIETKNGLRGLHLCIVNKISQSESDECSIYFTVEESEKRWASRKNTPEKYHQMILETFQREKQNGNYTISKIIEHINLIRDFMTFND